MQLPRGTLHSVKKNLQPSILFKEISGEKFTGHCNIYTNSGSASIVFREGRCILAKTGQFSGFDAYKRIEMDPFNLSAELYTFTETQIGLSTEFNPDCTVVFPTKTPLPKKSEEKQAVPQSRILAEVKRQQRSEDGMKSDSPKDIDTLFEFRPAVNPKVRKPKSDFQLPRGKFVAIQKLVPLLHVLTFAEENNFSGYIVIDIGTRKASTIFRHGMCVMIDYPPAYGEEAIRELQTDFGIKVTAELYVLSPQQMELTLEFNEGYWANNWTKKTGVSVSSLSRDSRAEKQNDRGGIAHKNAEKPGFTTETKYSAPRGHATTDIELNPKKDETAEMPGDEELDEFAKQVSTLEHMDMEQMESRIRDNFKDVIKELDLEYLLANKETEKPIGDIND
jgi:hypothetical protein